MRAWLIPFGCACVLGLSAQAQEAPAPPPPSVRQACQADIQKFCAGVQPGGGRIRACMAEHRDELSTACQDALATVRAHRPHGANGSGPQDAPSKPQ